MSKKAVPVSMEGVGNKSGALDERISNDQPFSLVHFFLKKVQYYKIYMTGKMSLKTEI